MRPKAARYLIILVAAAPAAAVVWFVFHAIYTNVSRDASIVGYVDPGTSSTIAMGYIAMVGGTIIFGAIALWAAIRLIGALRRGE